MLFILSINALADSYNKTYQRWVFSIMKTQSFGTSLQVIAMHFYIEMGLQSFTGLLQRIEIINTSMHGNKITGNKHSCIAILFTVSLLLCQFIMI